MASHASGITIGDALRNEFASSNTEESKIRFIKAQIDEETMEVKPTNRVEVKGTWEEDLDLVPDVLDKKDGCYVLYRTDMRHSGGSGFRWNMFCYVPDACKVRQKMLYASTRSTVKMALGDGIFLHEVFGTVPGDFDAAGFNAYLRMKESDAPLTESEEAKKMDILASSAEAGSYVGGGASSSMLHGVSFTPHDEAVGAVKELVDPANATNCVQLGIDEDKEEIVLREKYSSVTPETLAGLVPLDTPSFFIYRWDHEHEDKHLESIVFIYCCPDGTGKTKRAPIKARMLYSSCKSGVEGLVTAAGSQVDLKLEINEGPEITEEHIRDKLHPPPIQKPAGFSKPKPAGKGPKRLTSKSPKP